MENSKEFCCSRCGLNVRFEDLAKHPGTKSGRLSYCTECRNKRYREKYAADPTRWKRANAKYRSNPDNHERAKTHARQKANEKYWENPEKYRATTTKYRLANPEKVRSATRRWQASHKLERLEYARRWRSANKEKVRQRSANWRVKNPEKWIESYRKAGEKWRAANPELVKEGGRRWRQKNPEKLRMYARKYSAKKANAPGNGLTEDQWRDICLYYEYRCIYCLTQLNENTVTCEHLVPISKGGAHDVSNVAPACTSCNSARSNRDIDDWILRCEKKGRLFKELSAETS